MTRDKRENFLTIKDIATRIAFVRSEEGIQRTLRQVRHWTQSDLLHPISAKSTGKGIPRMYSAEPTIYIAAFLLELSRYGATVEIMKPVSDALYEDWDTDGLGTGWYISTAMTDMNTYLQVAWDTDEQTGEFIGAHVHMYDDMETFDRRRQSESFMMEEPSSSILINMTRVMDRIFPLSGTE